MNQAAPQPTGFLEQGADSIATFDPDLWQAMSAENLRQEQHIELIASENYASPRVLEAQGSVLTTSMPRVTPVSATTGAANLLMSPRTSPLPGRKSCSVPPTPMFSPTRVQAPILRFITRCSSPVTRSWV